MCIYVLLFSVGLQLPKTSLLHARLISHFLLSNTSCTAAAHMATSCCGCCYATVERRDWLRCPSLLSLCLIYGNVSSKASWLTARNKLDAQTSIKLPLKRPDKQMVTWSHLKLKRRLLCVWVAYPNKIKSGTRPAATRADDWTGAI